MTQGPHETTYCETSQIHCQNISETVNYLQNLGVRVRYSLQRTRKGGSMVETTSAPMESEKDKMIQGRLYRALDPQLMEDRARCRRLVADYNATEGPHGCLAVPRVQNL
jgi:hypothetical protein